MDTPSAPAWERRGWRQGTPCRWGCWHAHCLPPGRAQRCQASPAPPPSAHGCILRRVSGGDAKPGERERGWRRRWARGGGEARPRHMEPWGAVTPPGRGAPSPEPQLLQPHGLSVSLGLHSSTLTLSPQKGHSLPKTTAERSGQRAPSGTKPPQGQPGGAAAPSPYGRPRGVEEAEPHSPGGGLSAPTEHRQGWGHEEGSSPAPQRRCWGEKGLWLGRERCGQPGAQQLTATEGQAGQQEERFDVPNPHFPFL